MYDRQGQRISMYFDITAGNHFDNPDNPWFADLYLDIVSIEDVLEILDRDELDEALENGDITREEYDHAISVCQKLYEFLRENQTYMADWCDQAFRELRSVCADD